jgi:hypothetical protein
MLPADLQLRVLLPLRWFLRLIEMVGRINGTKILLERRLRS